MNTQKALIAEFLGTFTLVFIGAGVVTVAPQFGVVVAALGHGLILVGLIYAYGHLSGAHFNPAVTLGLLIGGHIEPAKAALYMIVQFLGGIVAAFLLVALIPASTFPSNEVLTAFNYGQTTGALTANDVWIAAGWEVVLTFFLVSTIYQAAVYGKAGNLAAVAIGFTLAAAILAGGFYGGASLNPARTLGPAIAAGDFAYVIPYFVGTFGGGALAGVVHTFLLNEEKA